MSAIFARARAHALMLIACATLLVPALAVPAACAAPAAGSAALTDANIVAIVETANTGDARNGALAGRNAADAAVKDFGKMMVTDHGSANQKTRALAAKLHLRARQNATSRSLARTANAKHAQLARLHGAAFDKAYMDAEVTMHEQVLQMLDDKLIPGAQNAELKELLTGIRPVIQSHLDKAKEVRGNLKG